jgi:glycosyltransferase involved in cell wall biosynthesis
MNVSLIIGSHNPNLNWLEQAINSAKGCSFCEVIVVDDGSNPPIEGATIRKQNGGIYTARNAGIAAAKGDVIAQLDDDDILIPDNVAELFSYIEKVDSDVWHFPIYCFSENEDDVFACWEPITKEIYKRNQIPYGSWFKKSLWRELGGYVKSRAEDWDFWARAFKLGKKFTRFHLPIFRHRFHSQSLTYRYRLYEEEVVAEVRAEIQKHCDEL